MALQLIGANSAAATSLTIPSGHQPGDLLIMFAFRSGSTTPPTVPSGWTSKASNGANTCSAVIAYKIATSSSEVSGTWTNATNLVCHVYRGYDTIASSPIGTPVNANGTGNSISYPAVTLSVTGGSSLVAGFASHRTATNVNTAPTGMTLRTGIGAAAGSDTAKGVYSWSAQSVSVNASSGWESFTVEIFAAKNSFENYKFPRVGDGMSVGEKIR